MSFSATPPESETTLRIVFKARLCSDAPTESRAGSAVTPLTGAIMMVTRSTVALATSPAILRA